MVEDVCQKEDKDKKESKGWGELVQVAQKQKEEEGEEEGAAANAA